MNNIYNLFNNIYSAFDELLCINYPEEFIIELDINDINYLFSIFTFSDKYKKDMIEVTNKNNIIEKGIYSLNIIYLQTKEELFDFSLLYLEKIEKEIKENKITEQKYIILANYLKKIIELKNKMNNKNFIYNEDELVVYKKNNNYIYEFYF
jgi:hypothetical protein